MNFRPNATYRIQFHKEFNFADFKKIVPYLHRLGIRTIYASPVFEAVKGSMHGYDVTSPLKINPEIGTEKQLQEISKQLKSLGISWIQDIVPNHMAFHPQNPWISDLLQHGKDSVYADFFDVDFKKNDKLMLPVLEKSVGQSILENKVSLVKKGNRHFISAGGNNWPLNPATQKKLRQETDLDVEGWKSLLDEILDNQHYRLCSFEETNHKINYRRFFTVNSLICLNMQHKKVFDWYHRYIAHLVNSDIFQGLRVDHIDGLADPEAYLRRLRKLTGEDTYIVVEKILQHHEQMPLSWPVQGTTGYEFLANISNLFTSRAAESDFDESYRQFTGKAHQPDHLAAEKKNLILNKCMAGELQNLCKLFTSSGLMQYTGLREEEVKQLISDLLVYFPVYRLYEYTFPLSEEARKQISDWLDKLSSKQDNRIDISRIRYILLELPEKKEGKFNLKLGHFFRRLMQYTGPLMAKGIEDTLMFTYNRFTVHNEVGDQPAAFGMTPEEFHYNMSLRQQYWPCAMNASTTHDTKKGEDVRARLNVLTQVPRRWKTFISSLQLKIAATPRLKMMVGEVHPNDLYLLIQTIVGSVPFEGLNSDDFITRVQEYISKILREGKKRSGWNDPDENYESKLFETVKELLINQISTRKLFEGLLRDLSVSVIVNSLAQQLLKFTCPGIPDIYQGTELWELSLVDPDNRRAVDYSERERFLKLTEDRSFHELYQLNQHPFIKLKLTNTLLKIRNRHTALFTEGSYIPLSVKGKYASRILAFARKLESKWLLTVIPLATMTDADDGTGCQHITDWQDTSVILPDFCPLSWEEIFSGHSGFTELPETGIEVNQLFKVMPLALVELKPEKYSSDAGVLLHISSLPSRFAVGSLGSEAYDFIDFLQKAGQSYWQILPLSPVDRGTGYSPYSSVSSSAGNILFISTEKLCNLGLLTQNELSYFNDGLAGKIDFEAARAQVEFSLAAAFRKFNEGNHPGIQSEFEYFNTSENHWLEDYATYEALKIHLKESNWSKWPARFKNRNQTALRKFCERHAGEIMFIRWQQYIFFKQWRELKAYATCKGVRLIGDLPFYLDYNACEVWTEPELFDLNENLQPVSVAGVPPDYFNGNGQLWGMPLFNWKQMAKDDYRWWQERIILQMKRFDLLRLDHFRAFCEYWSVEAGQETAVHGVWKEAPGNVFFEFLLKSYGSLPVIAEDLGEPSNAVNELIDLFELPPMKVLQFGFGTDHPVSSHIPHRFDRRRCIAYTGTHDNNTIRGWFDTEISKTIKQQISQYAGFRIDSANVAGYFCRLSYSSIAQTVIVPMQDLLGLGAESRMNTPGKSAGNWTWRLSADQISEELTQKIRLLTAKYGRLPDSR